MIAKIAKVTGKGARTLEKAEALFGFNFDYRGNKLVNCLGRHCGLKHHIRARFLSWRCLCRAAGSISRARAAPLANRSNALRFMIFDPLSIFVATNRFTQTCRAWPARSREQRGAAAFVRA
jgi:hypothetical protein